jgi:hypothetical protein
VYAATARTERPAARIVKTAMERRDQAARATLLRASPQRKLSAEGRVLWIRIMAELALIHKSSEHSGAVKTQLFERGARQLAELK